MILKKNKTLGNYISSQELLLTNILIEIFGEHNIQIQTLIKNWPIDIFVKNISIYIQVDGIYWHGLNASIEKLNESKTKHSKSIIKKISTDIKQNQYFKENNLQLVRITDKEVDFCKKNKNFDSIINKILCI